MRRRQRAVAGPAILWLLLGAAACGGAEGLPVASSITGSSAVPDKDSPVASSIAVTSVVPDEDSLRVMCANIELGSPDDVALPDTPMDAGATEALAQAVEEVGVEGESLLDYEWSIAAREESHLLLLGRVIDGEDASYAHAALAREDDGWHLSGWGGCRPVVEAPGYGPAARLVLDPEVEPSPDSDQLAVWINEASCASGMAPVDRAVIPVVVDDDDRVVITVLVEPVEGGADCQGNPWHPITITLDQPLGERQVFDGSTVPPERRPWPPTAQSLDR
jgi:hypothetical protein